MAILFQTQWHGNPRPRRSYKWFDVTAGVLTQGVSYVPAAEKDDPASGSTDVAGPAAAVEVSLAGPFAAGTIIDYGFIGDVSIESSGLYNVPYDASPEEVAAAFAEGFTWEGGNANVDPDNPRTIQIAAAGTNTTVGVDTWNVLPPA